ADRRRRQRDEVVAEDGGEGRPEVHLARKGGGRQVDRSGGRRVVQGKVDQMSLATHPLPRRGVLLRHSRWDALLVALAFGHGALLAVAPVAPVIALGVWWNSNTVAHYFIHAPFFRSRRLNWLFELYLSGLLGIPQTIWSERHLAHHAG